LARKWLASQRHLAASAAAYQKIMAKAMTWPYQASRGNGGIWQQRQQREIGGGVMAGASTAA